MEKLINSKKINIMRVKVTEHGLVIPKEWLEGIQEVEFRQEDDHIVVTPAIESDSIAGFGTTTRSQIPKGTLTGLRGIARRLPTLSNDAELQEEYTDYLTQKY